MYYKSTTNAEGAVKWKTENGIDSIDYVTKPTSSEPIVLTVDIISFITRHIMSVRKVKGARPTLAGGISRSFWIFASL